MQDLTKQEQIFVKIVAETGNATKAYREAFNKKDDDKGNKVSSVMGYRLLGKASIIEAINGLKKTIADRISDDLLYQTHNELLRSTRLDHMVFPLGPEDEEEPKNLNITDKTVKTMFEVEQAMQRTTLTDKDIKEMLAEVNCVVRKIVHGEQARHVYFWAPDNMARDKALDKGYKLKGVYAPEKSVNVNLNGDIIPNEELLKIAEKIKQNETTRDNTTKSIGRNGADTKPVGKEVSD